LPRPISSARIPPKLFARRKWSHATPCFLVRAQDGIEWAEGRAFEFCIAALLGDARAPVSRRLGFPTLLREARLDETGLGLVRR
jgi:hypothetical protein